MNTLAFFIHSNIEGNQSEAEKELSGLEKKAWVDLQSFLSRSKQNAIEVLKTDTLPNEWP